MGMLGGSGSIHAAMAFSSCEIVCLLLDYGADPKDVDAIGNDALSFACFTGMADNIELWCKRFTEWDLDFKNNKVGGYALGSALYVEMMERSFIGSQLTQL